MIATRVHTCVCVCVHAHTCMCVVLSSHLACMVQCLCGKMFVKFSLMEWGIFFLLSSGLIWGSALGKARLPCPYSPKWHSSPFCFSQSCVGYHRLHSPFIMKTLGVAEKGSLLPWLSFRDGLPPSQLGRGVVGWSSLSGARRWLQQQLGVNYDQPRLPSTNSHWP